MTPRGQVGVETTASDLRAVAGWLERWAIRSRQRPPTLLGPTREEVDAEAVRLEGLVARLRRGVVWKDRKEVKLDREDARRFVSAVECEFFVGLSVPAAVHRFEKSCRSAAAPRGRPRRSAQTLAARIAAFEAGTVPHDEREIRRDRKRLRFLQWVEAECARGKTILTMDMPPGFK